MQASMLATYATLCIYTITSVYSATNYTVNNRIRQELKDLNKSSLLKANGISVHLPSDSNIHLLRATMQAPKKSLYEG